VSQDEYTFEGLNKSKLIHSAFVLMHFNICGRLADKK